MKFVLPTSSGSRLFKEYKKNDLQNYRRKFSIQSWKKYGKFIAKQITPTHTKKREFYMYENKVFINDGYVTFNIIELNRNAGKITVNINNTGHHIIDTFELKDLDGWTYFEYGRPVPEKFI